jgi:hypothetical protein
MFHRNLLGCQRLPPQPVPETSHRRGQLLPNLNVQPDRFGADFLPQAKRAIWRNTPVTGEFV